MDPGSYLVHTLVDDAEWLPLELAPPSGPRVDPHDPHWIAMHEALADEAARMEVPFRIPNHVPHSRKAMELALHAAEKGRFPQVHAALFRAHFVDGLDLERIDHLVRIAAAAELEEAEVRTILGVDRFRPEIEAIRERLRGEGIRGVPTIRRDGSTLEGFRSADDLKIFLEDG